MTGINVTKSALGAASVEIWGRRRPASKEGCRLLIVDDHVDIADALCVLFEMRGCLVRPAYRGAAALTLAFDWKPDLIFLDLSMPDLGGLEVAQRIRQSGELKDVAIVAHTALRDEKTRVVAQNIGFDAFCGKPASVDVLEEVVASLTWFPDPHKSSDGASGTQPR